MRKRRTPFPAAARRLWGAAKAGFDMPPGGTERTSRLADSMPYNQYQEAATGKTRENFAKIFRYHSQTEEQSLHLAEEMLYFQQDGQRRFLKDIDENEFQELVQSLDDATAWNAPQMDAARMIQSELQGRAVNMEIDSEEYTDFLRIMREHETATGQGVQANAKWSRKDNQGGKATELEAWENLENSNLSGKEKQERMRRIITWDKAIETVPAGNSAAMKQIILEVAQERGVISGPFGRVFRKIADSSLDSLTFDQLKQFAYSSTAALSTDSTPTNLGQKAKTIQILNMLSNPKSAAKNLVGNTTFYGLDAISMKGAAILDMAIAKATGTRSIAYEKSSLKEAAKAMQMAVAEITMDVDMGGETTRYGTGSSRTFKASGNIVDRAFSALERNQAYLLTATDEFFKGAARSTAAQTQKLVDQGKIKTTDTDYAKNQAEQLAKYRTFQDDSKMSVAIQQLHDLFNLIGFGDSGKKIKGETVHAFGAGDIVAPFTRVAGNLVSRGLEYSPLNAVKGAVEVVQQVANAARGKSVDAAKQAEGVSDLARGMTGTAIAYGFMQLALAGLLRQAEDEDDQDVAALNQSEGIAGTQFNLDAAQRMISGGSAEWQTGDTLIDLSSIEPLNLLMNLGTEMAKSPQNPILSSFNSTLDSFGAAAAELPVLQSVGDFAKDVFLYGNDWKESAMEQAGKTIVSSLTPNILSAAAKGLDDRPRNAYAGDDLWDIIQSSFKSRIPVLRETLPGSVNTMGEEKTYQGSQADILLNAMLNPIGVNTYAQSEVSKEMERVRKATGDAGFYPSKTIPKKLEYTDGDGEKHIQEMDYEQRQDFQRDRGTTIILTSTDLIADRRYKNANAEKQGELLNDVNTYAYEAAKANVMGADSVSAWVKKTMDAQKSIHLNPATVILYRDMLTTEKDKDQTTAEANQAVRGAIFADSGLTAKQKNALDNIVISDGVYIPKDVEVDYSNKESYVISQMSDGAQKRWSGIKAQFGMSAEDYTEAWGIYHDDGLKADQKREKLSALGYNGAALYKALGKKLG